MHTLGCRALLLAALVPGGILPLAQAEPPAAINPSPGVRLDGDGQPLPLGAKYRLGTRDWRHAGEGWSICYSPDGNRIAFISRFAKLVVMDAASGKTIFSGQPKMLDGTPVQGKAIAFSSDGTELAIKVDGGVAQVFDPVTLRHLRTYQAKIEDEFGAGGRSLCYSTDGRYFAIAGGASYAVLDRKTGEQIIHEKTAAEIQGLAFSRDGDRFFVASMNPSVKVWDVAKREITHRWNDGDDHFVHGPAIAPDGRTIAVGTKEVVIGDVETNQVKHRLKADDPQELFMDMAFTADGRLVVGASQEGPVYVWEIATGARRWKLTSDSWAVRNMAIRPDGKQVATSDAKNRIWVWSLETGELLFNERPAHDAAIEALVFTPDGSTLITGSGGRDTHVWDVVSGKHVRNLQKSSNWLAITRDEKLLSSWYGAPQLRTWDWRTGQQVVEWTAPEPRIRTFCLSSNATHVVALLDLDTPQEYRIVRLAFPSLQPAGDMKNQGHARGCLAIAPDGRLAAVGAFTGIDIWDLAKSKFAVHLPYPEHWSSALQFTYDGRFLLAANSDDSVTVWELSTSKLARVLGGHDRCPGALALNPSGRIVAAAGAYSGRRIPVGVPHQIHFWDLMTGKKVAVLSGHDEDISALAFSPDGTLLAAGMQDTTTLLWEVPESARAKGLRQEPLTEAEAAALWEDLASPSAELGQNAVSRLAHDTKTALALAEQKLQPVVLPPAKEIQSLFAELDAEAFEKREAAMTRLAEYGSTIAGPLKEAAEKSEAAEIRLRCNELLGKADKKFEQAGPILAQTRAVQLLEWIGNPDAVAFLKRLAGGAKDAHQTKEVAAALARLEK